jgi:hypothetical protein
LGKLEYWRVLLRLTGLQLLFLCLNPLHDPFPNTAIGAVLAELFESLNLGLDLHYLFRRMHGCQCTLSHNGMINCAQYPPGLPLSSLVAVQGRCLWVVALFKKYPVQLVPNQSVSQSICVLMSVARLYTRIATSNTLDEVQKKLACLIPYDRHYPLRFSFKCSTPIQIPVHTLDGPVAPLMFRPKNSPFVTLVCSQCRQVDNYELIKGRNRSRFLFWEEDAYSITVNCSTFSPQR